MITPPETTFAGSIVYAKAGNVWIQTGKDVKQLTSGGEDSMPAFSPDGAWVYFIRIQEGRGKFPAGGYLRAGVVRPVDSGADADKPDGSGGGPEAAHRPVQDRHLDLVLLAPRADARARTATRSR